MYWNAPVTNSTPIVRWKPTNSASAVARKSGTKSPIGTRISNHGIAGVRPASSVGYARSRWPSGVANMSEASA